MSQILVDIQLSSADSTSSGFTDILGFNQSAVVGDGSSVILLIATLPQRLTDTSDDQFDMRFEIDSTLVGPEVTYFKDNDIEGCGASICYATVLTAGSHDFACQWRHRAGTANTDTGRVRNFQVIEITDASLLVDSGDVISSDSAVSGYTDVIDCFDTQTPASAGSILIFLANMTCDDSGFDATVTYSFAVDDVEEGPEQVSFIDAANDVCAVSMMWMKTGVSGSTKFALRWDEDQSSIIADTSRVRNFQVIEITANALLPFTPVTSQAADTLTGAYTDIVDLTSGAFTIDSADSILLFAGGITQVRRSDDQGVYRFYDGSTGEGPEMHCYNDATNEGCGHSIFWAVTGKTGSHTFTMRGQNLESTVNMATDRLRSFAICELTAAPDVARPRITNVGQAINRASSF